MGAVYCLATLLALYIQLGTSLGDFNTTSMESDLFTTTIRMPNVVSERPDSLICTRQQMGPEEMYIVKFTPHANKTTAHHMVVYACRTIFNPNQSWTCDQDYSHTHPEHEVCGDGTKQIMFAWALDASEKSLPQGVGMRVSGDTGINYLVLQLHYTKVFPAGYTDVSGITLTMTYTRPQQQVGYVILGNWGIIPPHKPEVHLDSYCRLNLDYTIYPFAFRTHSHNLGVVTSGYRNRKGVWKLIGKMSPKRPQTFYTVSDPGMDIKSGDIVASRCIMNSMSRTTDTVIGQTNHDEMCNFYIMYSTYDQRNLENIFCFRDAKYSWSDNFNASEIPPDSGSLEGIPEAE